MSKMLRLDLKYLGEVTEKTFTVGGIELEGSIDPGDFTSCLLGRRGDALFVEGKPATFNEVYDWAKATCPNPAIVEMELDDNDVIQLARFSAPKTEDAR